MNQIAIVEIAQRKSLALLRAEMDTVLPPSPQGIREVMGGGRSPNPRVGLPWAIGPDQSERVLLRDS